LPDPFFVHFVNFVFVFVFFSVKNLKFRCEEQSNLNDILLRISAFGLFTYSVFSVIAGSLKFLESEPDLLVMTTGAVAVFQVILQLLFIADVSRRRVHLPEHDRSKPGRQIVTFLLICNVAMFAVYTFEAQKVSSNPVSRYVRKLYMKIWKNKMNISLNSTVQIISIFVLCFYTSFVF